MIDLQHDSWLNIDHSTGRKLTGGNFNRYLSTINVIYICIYLSAIDVIPLACTYLFVKRDYSSLDKMLLHHSILIITH